MSTNIYNHHNIEKKWQNKWEADSLFAVDNSHSKANKYYCLDMFPYPSGSGLHVGHVKPYVGTDVVSRYMRMKGYEVLHPMGWDSFGLPAENYAIKTGIHPLVTTENAIKMFKSQLNNLGMSYDWSREVAAHTPEFYRWTQWLFLKLYEHKLAYKRYGKVNWCESCQTVLANEQVTDGKCERCENIVIKKDLNQWFFGITNYAEELLQGLDNLDWPESTQQGQRNWIGKSEGVTFEVKISASGKVIDTLSIFTTRIDTFAGVKFIVIAPEHGFWRKNQDKIINWAKTSDYISNTNKYSDIERSSTEKIVTGVKAEGIYYTHPLTGEKIPIYVADYVLANYGTGVVMGVPGHDNRDWRFAQKFGIDSVSVIELNDEERVEVLVNSGKFSGLDLKTAKIELQKYVKGRLEVKYRLRDWLISRQRYWGAPIPIVYDPEGNAHPVPDEHLPWLLPTDVEFRPTGSSPLQLSKELKERTERIFGKGWYPEVDTMDTFVCSSWYYLRFADPSNDTLFASESSIKKWLPVDAYIGGAEHTVLHLLYARFVTKVLRDLGYLTFDEPFLKLKHQGLVLASDRRKMSKRWGNVINPDDVIEKYGADTLRLYEVFMGPFADTIPWSDQGLVGCRRFLDKVWLMSNKIKNEGSNVEINSLIEKVGDDIANYKFNTAIASMMKWTNLNRSNYISKENWNVFLRLLAPFAPHIVEELWFKLGNSTSIHLSNWPHKIQDNQVRNKSRGIPVQINGKVKFVIDVSEDDLVRIEEIVRNDTRLSTWVNNLSIARIIVVGDKLVNVVAN